MSCSRRCCSSSSSMRLTNTETREISTSTLHSDHCISLVFTNSTTTILALYYQITTTTTITTTTITTALLHSRNRALGVSRKTVNGRLVPDKGCTHLLRSLENSGGHGPHSQRFDRDTHVDFAEIRRDEPFSFRYVSRRWRKPTSRLLHAVGARDLSVFCQILVGSLGVERTI